MAKNLSTFFNALLLAQKKLAIELYFVGGCVRDALLGELSDDFDLVTSGELDQLRALMTGWDFECSLFGTLSTTLEGKQIDLATFRKESYNDQSGLPQVFPGTIEDDILRRDFTVNTGYVKLSEDSIANFIGETGHLSEAHKPLEIAFSHPKFEEDVRKRQLRILHKDSFKEDATRMLRAVKYTTVKGFFMEAETQRALEHAVKERIIDRCSKVRVREILLNLASANQGELMIEKCIRWKLLPFLQASDDGIALSSLGFEGLSVRLNDQYPETFAKVKKGLLTLLYAYRGQLDFFDGAERSVQKLARQCEKIKMLKMDEPKPLYDQLVKAEPETVIFAMLLGVLNEARYAYYKTHLEGIRLELSGDDLKDMGFKEGPMIGDALKRLLDTEIEHGENYSKEKEIEWIESVYDEYGH